MNIDTWVVGISNQLFIRGSYTETKFSEKWSSYWQNSVLFDRSILDSPFYFYRKWLLTGQFCMKMLSFQAWFFQLQNSAPVFWKKFFRKFVSKLKYWNFQNFQWLSHKSMPISQTDGRFENLYTVFLVNLCSISWF